MFPRDTTDAPARRSLSELLRDALGTAVEFATLGEATFDEQVPAKVRYLRPEEAATMQDDHRPSDVPAPQVAACRPVSSADVVEHPHRLALRRPTRPRRPGAVPPRPPVCTMPVTATPYRPADGVLPPSAPFAHRSTPQD